MRKQKRNPKRIQIVTKFTEDFWVCLANLRENKGHDDCLPYQADVYVMEKTVVLVGTDKMKWPTLKFTKVASVWNDGWGGDSNVEVLNPDLVQKVQDECLKHQMYYNGSPFGQYDLEALCDEMASIWVDAIKDKPQLADNTFVYMMDDDPLIKAYNGNNLLYYKTQKFAYND